MIDVKRCKECDGVINGRSDKQYCDDICRSAYNNKRNRNRFFAIQAGNKILKNNYLVLDKLSALEQPRECIEYINLGFDFEYITGIELYQGKMMRRCYDYLYELTERGLVYVVKKDTP